jgi:hypothetical protein
VTPMQMTFDAAIAADKAACGLCGSTSLTDLGYGDTEGTVICHACGAHWWRVWMSRRDWDAWINGGQGDD